MAGSIGGGRSNFAMTPVRRDGKTREFENMDHNIEVIGCHTGDSAGLNVANPIPGMQYQWVRNDATARMLEGQKGGSPVLAGDEDFPAYELGLGGGSERPTPLDTSTAYKDVVLFRYREEDIAERRRQDAKRAERMVSGASDEYLHGASPAELASSQGARTRFARRQHTLQMQDEGGAVQRQWTPELGILED